MSSLIEFLLNYFWDLLIMCFPHIQLKLILYIYVCVRVCVRVSILKNKII